MSMEVVPLDRLPMASYQCSIVTLSLKHTVFLDIRLLSLETLKPGLGVTQGHQN